MGRSVFVSAFLTVWALLCGIPLAGAQGPPLTLGQVIAQALERYPAIRAASERLAAADMDVALARSAYLPRADLLWQVNRATRNNITGLLLPQSVIAPISGPVPLADSINGVWNSAAGMLFTWEPIDFGARASVVRAAEAGRHATEADAALTRLQVSAASADAFFSVLAADEAVRAAAAGVERARVLFDVVDARARAGLRPGADAARARAEVAAAESAQARVEQTAAIARAELARWLGIAPEQVAVAPGLYGQLPPFQPAAVSLSAHPLVESRAALVESATASATAVAHTFAPRIFLEGTTYVRGSGVTPDGTIGRGAAGLGFDRHNWAIGVNVTFPLFDFAALNQRHAQELAREREAQAHYDQALQDLSGDIQKADASLAAARRVAALTPAQLDAARTAEEQARARYAGGLGTIADVADTQRLLTEADTANALAILGVWRSQLAVAAARGDLSPVLNQRGP